MKPACYDADFILCNGVYEPMSIIDTTGPEATQAVLEGFGFSTSGKGVLAVSCIRLIMRLAFLLSVLTHQARSSNAFWSNAKRIPDLIPRLRRFIHTGLGLQKALFHRWA